MTGDVEHHFISVLPLLYLLQENVHSSLLPTVPVVQESGHS